MIIERIRPMKRTMVTAEVLSLLGVSVAFAEDAEIAAKRDRVSLFEVALRCEAAPEIGCGSRTLPTNFYRIDIAVPRLCLLSSLFGTPSLFT
jgi:hypothetical protein